MLNGQFGTVIPWGASTALGYPGNRRTWRIFLLFPVTRASMFVLIASIRDPQASPG